MPTIVASVLDSSRLRRRLHHGVCSAVRLRCDSDHWQFVPGPSIYGPDYTATWPSRALKACAWCQVVSLRLTSTVGAGHRGATLTSTLGSSLTRPPRPWRYARPLKTANRLACRGARPKDPDFVDVPRPTSPGPVCRPGFCQLNNGGVPSTFLG